MPALRHTFASMPCLPLVLALIAACLAPHHAQAQRTPPTLTLSRPAWTAAEPFTHITAVRELASGAVLLADIVDRRVHFVSAGGRAMRTIGRIGAGPREFSVPAALVALRGDSTLLLDRDQRRFLIVTPTGELLDARRFPEALQQGAEFVRGADASGRLYFQASGLPATERNPFVALKRWDRRTGQIDSVAAVRMPNPKPVRMAVSPGMKEDGFTGTMTARRIMPFSPEDAWAIAPSGRLVIVRTSPYGVEWLEPNGRVVRGAPVVVTPVPVVDADHRAFETPGMRIQLTYPEVKPPFREDPVIDADDNVWVRRETRAGATMQPWDVFGADGAHRGVVTLPMHKRIAAITRRFVYVSRTDDDALQWLEAYTR
jgi:hypothetical protein